MPFKRPTPKELLERIQTEFDLYLPGADARLRRSVEFVLARALVIASHDLNSYIEYLSKQILVNTADAEFLERHADKWGIDRKTGGKASGGIIIFGNDDATVPAGSIYQDQRDNKYILNDDATINAGTVIGNVTALEIGVIGNADAGTKLTLISPVAGIQSEATVDGDGLGGGADVEGDTSLAGRIIERIQNPPHGGAKSDYVTWAKEVPGVTRAWAYPTELGLGTVSVTFVLDTNSVSIIPTAADIQNVADHINEKRPVTSDVTVFAPTPVAIDFDISLNPNSIIIQNAVKAEIEDFFIREATPGGTLYLSRLQEAISTAEGEFNHVLNGPVADINVDFGQMPVVGNFSWSDA